MMTKKMSARRALVVMASLAASAGLAGCTAAPRKKPVGQATGLAPADAPAPLVGHNLIRNSSFAQPGRSLPWTASFSAPAAGRTYVDKGELCMAIQNKGVNRWDAHLRQQNLLLEKGHTYHVQFKIHASDKTRAYLKIGLAGPPYREFWKLLFDLDTAPQVFAGTFTMATDDGVGVEMAFHAGGALAKAKVPFSVCIDDVRIDDPQYTEASDTESAPVPGVLVNQVGYFPRRAKLAIVKNPAAVPWELVDARNQVVASGTTVPFGADRASGDQVSVADFSTYAVEGTGFTVRAAGAVSHPFDISDGLYGRLKYHALAFYYQNRSGIPIQMPYAEDPKWTRAAGHIGVPPNRGDTQVTCAPLPLPPATPPATTPGAAGAPAAAAAPDAADRACTYFLDVSGGWYDAGDQGKYVVNAGISVWTLLDLWERTNALGWSAADFGDGKMNIPENKNGVPDLLDEARWELEFELKMQVPEGERLAGMVHHKMHDAKWAPDVMSPPDDPLPRYLQPPSTAATLNLAANAAQAARIWRKLDPKFAKKCLAAAERAWSAAEKHPEIYAPPGGDGGGPYDDKNLGDDFYWAAAELFITTKEATYRDFIRKSEHFKQVTVEWTDNPGMFTSMTWGDTRALGSISLAIVPNGLTKAEVAAIRKNIVDVADVYLGLIPKEGYRLPFAVPQKGYPWGSNSFVANNALMLALAYDFTQEPKYLDGVTQGMDYLLGRNPLDQSFVTGYGDRPLVNPYHRFWCHQANAKYPSPPPGILSGGPNSELQDPWVQSAGLAGCAPQKCFMDHGGAWSVNEITINWNAPLAWVAAFLDEKARSKPPASGSAAAARPSRASGLTRAKSER